MPRTNIISIDTSSDDLNANVYNMMVYNRFEISSEAWGMTTSGKKTASQVTVKVDYSIPVYGDDDYETTVKFRFEGNFSKKDGLWTGDIQKVKIFNGVDKVGVFNTNGLPGLEDVYNYSQPGVIWQAIGLAGFNGRLTNGDNRIDLGLGNDVVKAGKGHDSVNGSAGDDRIWGDGGVDFLNGGDGNDKLFGGKGADTLYGGTGNDILLGGGGGDRFKQSDSQTDTWTGGRGADIFEISTIYTSVFGATVTDFKKRQGDKIDLSADSAFHFNTYDEVRYIGDSAFSGEAGVYEIRMENGFVQVDNSGDGVADGGLYLQGHDSFANLDTSWLLLPDGMEFG